MISEKVFNDESSSKIYPLEVNYSEEDLEKIVQNLDFLQKTKYDKKIILHLYSTKIIENINPQKIPQVNFGNNKLIELFLIGYIRDFSNSTLIGFNDLLVSSQITMYDILKYTSKHKLNSGFEANSLNKTVDFERLDSKKLQIYPWMQIHFGNNASKFLDERKNILSNIQSQGYELDF